MTVLNEKERRIFAAFEAEQLGPEGDAKMLEITGIDRKTLLKGREELYKQLIEDNIRKGGGGRLALDKKDPNFLKLVDNLVQEDTAGDPVTGKKWIKRTLRSLKQMLETFHLKVSLNSLRKYLKKLGYSLRVNRKKNGNNPSTS